MENDYITGSPSISRRRYLISGIVTTVFGLDELPPETSEVACLWLLHPRSETQEWMAGVAASILEHWNKRLLASHANDARRKRGLIAVTFDQRNHGTRKIDPLANLSWKEGNPRHAQDMFSIFRK
jgi:hypothetical protein